MLKAHLQSCYEVAMNPDQSVSETAFTALDFETTGLYPASDRIVELGAVQFQDGQILATFEALVDPGVPISKEILAITGISDDMLVGKPTLAATLPEFVSFIGATVIVAHNAPFDVGFLRAGLQVVGLPDVKNAIVDTQQLAQKAFPGQRSYSLQNLVAYLRFPPNNAHRALDDSMMCMKLFEACARELSFMGDLRLADVLT